MLAPAQLGMSFPVLPSEHWSSLLEVEDDIRVCATYVPEVTPLGQGQKNISLQREEHKVSILKTVKVYQVLKFKRRAQHMRPAFFD